LKGYSYQIWQSLFRWFDLAPKEELFLEGAEDIDLLGPGTAETVQVKDLSAPITLRSPSIVAAINNFWQHKVSNTATAVFFRLLTTASRAVEQERPFGSERGLDVWDRVKSPGVQIESLREYLVSLPNLSHPVKEFLKSASAEDLRRDLICRIEWDTGNENQEFLEEIVSRKAIDFGERVFNLSPAESRKAVPHLLSHVWRTVLHPSERVLRRSDLSEAFEKATMELVPKLELERLRAEKALLTTYVRSPIGGSDARDLVPMDAAVIEEFSSPSMGNFVIREALVRSAIEQVNSSGVLVLSGMTGMGKSILASQIISQLAGNWANVNFRGLIPDAVSSRLDLLARKLESSPYHADFLFDDLNFDQRIDLYEKKVEKLLYLFRLRRARVIFTSQNRMPASIIRNCSLRPESIVQMPSLVPDEIEVLCKLHGADTKTAKLWKIPIAAQTGGHPVLVHARVRGMQFRNWSAPHVTELFTSHDVDEVRQEFRKTLTDTLSQDSRNLLYRLSVFFNRFNRRQVLDLAGGEPSIFLAGEVFDRLIGPWIEPDGRDHYRLSPLLSDAAAKVFSEAEFKKLHANAASSYLKEEKITPQDANSILMHGIRGENPFPMMILLPKLLAVDEEYKDSVYELLSWFPLVNVENGQTFFKGFMLANSYIRQLQFAIQSHLHPEKVQPIIERWEDELNAPEGPLDIAGTSLSHKFTFLMDILIHTKAEIEPEKIAKYVTEMNVILRREEKMAPDFPEYDSEFWGSFHGLDDIAIFLGASVARFPEGGDIVRFLVALHQTDNAVTGEIWHAFDADIHLTTLAVDRLWLNETKQESPDWQTCIENLDLLSQIGIGKSVPSITAAALRAKAIIYEEYLKDQHGALDMLSQAESQVGLSHPLIDEYRARILIFRERFDEALDLLDRVINRSDGAPAGRYVVFRDAEMCSANLGRWSDAAAYAAKGMGAALQFEGASADGSICEETLAFAMTFQADRAYCLWKAGIHESAIKEFRSILEQFESLSSFEEDLRAQMLYRRVGYAIGWLAKGEKISKDFAFEPPIGWFSDFAIHNDVKSLARLPIEKYWILLADLEIGHALGSCILDDLFDKEIPPDRIPILWLLKMKAEVMNPDPSRLPEAFFRLARGGGHDVLGAEENASELLIGLMLPYLIGVTADTVSLPDVTSWREDLQNKGFLTASVNEWLYNVTDVFSMDVLQRSRCLRDPEQPSHRRLLAALVVTLSSDVDPETQLYAQIILVTSGSLRVWKDMIGEIIEQHAVRVWENIGRNHRFRLISPASTAPEILAACSDTSRSGFGKAAKVVLTAIPSVRLRIDEVLQNDLWVLSRNGDA